MSGMTDWFPPDVKPVHIGWYHTKEDKFGEQESKYNWWWDGRKWKFGPGRSETVCTLQDRPWRGMAYECAHGACEQQN